MPSVGPFETLASCQATMGSNPVAKRACEGSDLEGRRTLRAMVDDVAQQVGRLLGVLGLVEAGHRLFHVVGEGHLAVGVPEGEEGLEAFLELGVRSRLFDDEQPSRR